LQTRVRQRFAQLQAFDEHEGTVPWFIVNAAQSIDEVQQEINQIVDATIRKVQQDNTPSETMWQEKNKQENKEL
jgi:hypothetical protein